jgi:hypothetical protein
MPRQMRNIASEESPVVNLIPFLSSLFSHSRADFAALKSKRRFRLSGSVEKVSPGPSIAKGVDEMNSIFLADGFGNW